MKKGFTLIEVLVVVLIIGILAAIALPKYKVAVETSKIKSLLPIIKSLIQAEQSYYLANGSYTDELDNLDINIDAQKISSGYYETDWGAFRLYNTVETIIFKNDIIQMDFPYRFPSNKIICYSHKELGRKVCSRLASSSIPNDNWGTIYYIANL